jgi:NAD(P)-dependent dehydrogenase (short-subunit alcohol dehydrogenase family)
VATLRNPAGDGALRAAAAEAGVELDVRILDVTDPRAVESCVAGVVADHGGLDALVNNAGAGYVGTIEQVSMEDMRRVMEVNYFSVVAMTKAALPHLRTSGGRVVTVSSVGGAVGQPFNEAYCAAKFAVEGFLESLAPVAGAVGVGVSIVEPGPVATEFVNSVGVDIGAMFEAAGPYLPAMQAYLDRVMAMFGSDDSQTADQVAEVIIGVLGAEAPALRVQTGSWATEFVAMKLRDLDGSAVVGETSTWVA